jgi:hypothetical protein
MRTNAAVIKVKASICRRVTSISCVERSGMIRSDHSGIAGGASRTRTTGVACCGPGIRAANAVPLAIPSRTSVPSLMLIRLPDKVMT